LTIAGKGTQNGKGKRNGKGKGHRKGQGMVNHTAGRDDSSRAVLWQLLKDLHAGDFDMEGEIERVYFTPEALPSVPPFGDNDNDSTERSYSEYDEQHHSEVDMRMQDNVDATEGINSDSDVDIERNHDDYEVADEEEENEESEDADEEHADTEEDEDEDAAIEPPIIIQGEMVNTSVNGVDTMVDSQPIMLAEQGRKMREHTPSQEPQETATLPPALEPFPQSRTPYTCPLRCLEHFGPLMA